MSMLISGSPGKLARLPMPVSKKLLYSSSCCVDWMICSPSLPRDAIYICVCVDQQLRSRTQPYVHKKYQDCSNCQFKNVVIWVLDVLKAKGHSDDDISVPPMNHGSIHFFQVLS
uniref:Uncharacterized protein n=1 Tax=Opuntia streptacantha TaxID=393608 RepID=A0A7C9E0T9_OPUST